MTDYEETKKLNADANVEKQNDGDDVDNEDQEYEVGYGKPPKHRQYKKGRSGNPKGRKKGSRNFSTDLKDTLKEPVRVTKDGKRKKVSTQLATILRLREKALSGDGRALDKYIELARTYNDEDIAEMAPKLGQTEAEVLEAYDKRVLRRAAKSQPHGDDNARNDAAQDIDKAKANQETLEEDDDDAYLN